MNKELQTIYVPVSEKTNYLLDKFKAAEQHWGDCEYLSEQSRILLTAEEWESVQNMEKEKDAEIEMWKSNYNIIFDQSKNKIEEQDFEIERLKGLLEENYKAYEIKKYQLLDILLTSEQQEEMWQQFKKDNQL